MLKYTILFQNIHDAVLYADEELSCSACVSQYKLPRYTHITSTHSANATL